MSVFERDQMSKDGTPSVEQVQSIFDEYAELSANGPWHDAKADDILKAQAMGQQHTQLDPAALQTAIMGMKAASLRLKRMTD